MVVIDTSVLIDYLRGEALPEFETLVLNGQAVLSKVVKLELLSGVRKKEASQLEILFSGLVERPEFASASLCEKLLRRARGSGLFGGIPDLMIIADVVEMRGVLYTRDQRQERLAADLKIRLFGGK